MLPTYMLAYPWDLLDEGVEAALDRLQGEIGAEGLSLWVAGPPVIQLGLRGAGPSVFRTDGGVFFRPTLEHYAASRCKPILAEWVKTQNPLRAIADACRERALQLRVRVSASATGRLALRHPETAAKNVFGASSHRSVCLANPDVQAYLCGMAADLCANYGPAALIVTDFTSGWAEAFGSDLRAPLAPDGVERSLLSTCFCESCRQKAMAAGVDVDRAWRSVGLRLREAFDNGRASDSPVTGEADPDPALADLCRWRSSELSSLLRRMDEVCDCELLLDRGPVGGEHAQHAEPDLGIPAAVITRIDHADELSSAVCPAARRSELRVEIQSALGTRGGEFVGLLSQAADLGFAGVEMDDYGTCPEGALTTIKQGVRIARRTTSC